MVNSGIDIIGNPNFLILDEPFHGLDIEVKEAMMAIVKNLALYVDGESLLDLLLQNYKSQLFISGNIVNAYLVSYIA